MTKLVEKLLAKDKGLWVIVSLVGALILIIALPTSQNTTKVINESQKTQPQEENSYESYAKKIQLEVEEALSEIQGVGKAKLIITLKDQGECVVEKDITSYDKERSEKTIYNGSKEPYVTKHLYPEIEGVLVIAQGGDKESVKQKITHVILALFPVEAHKIEVVKMV